MKKYLLILFAALFAACTQHDNIIDVDPIDPEVPVDPIEKCRFKLGIANNQLNVFDLSTFTLMGENSDGWDFSLADVCQAYDSITWGVQGYSDRMKVFETNSSGSHFTYGWGHCFYNAGERDTYLVGYKNNEIVHTDTLRVIVANDKDCLMYNWSEVTDNDKTSIGFHNALTPNCTLTAIREIYDETPAIRFFYSMNINDDSELAAQNETLLYRLFSDTYGAPAFDKNSVELNEQYQLLFAHREDNVIPTSIWITPRSKLVLLTAYEEHWTRTLVHAEPMLY